MWSSATVDRSVDGTVALVDASYDGVLYLMCALFALSFVVLFWSVAPYGRHHPRGGGGRWEIPNHVGWLIMEGVAPVLISFWYWSGYVWAGRPYAFEKYNLLCYSLYAGHYIYRGYIFPFRLQTRGKTMPVHIAALAVMFNCMNTYCIGHYLGWQGGNTDTSPLMTVVGLAIFFGGVYINHRADEILFEIRRRKSDTKQSPTTTALLGKEGASTADVSVGGRYEIPHGFLYEFVDSPNYLGECIEWSGYAILLNSRAGWAFAFVTVANLLPRAVAHHRWYKTKFGEAYPAGRKALIPFLL